MSELQTAQRLQPTRSRACAIFRCAPPVALPPHIAADPRRGGFRATDLARHRRRSSCSEEWRVALSACADNHLPGARHMKLRISLSLAALAFAGACGEASLEPSSTAPEVGPSFAFSSVGTGAVRVQNSGCVSDIVATVPGELPFFVGTAPHCIRATVTASGGEALYFVWFNNGGLDGKAPPPKDRRSRHDRLHSEPWLCDQRPGLA